MLAPLRIEFTRRGWGVWTALGEMRNVPVHHTPRAQRFMGQIAKKVKIKSTSDFTVKMLRNRCAMYGHVSYLAESSPDTPPPSRELNALGVKL